MNTKRMIRDFRSAGIVMDRVNELAKVLVEERFVKRNGWYEVRFIVKATGRDIVAGDVLVRKYPNKEEDGKNKA